jgi:hypothetical protein
MHDFPDFASSYSTTMDQSHDARIALAIADIGDQIAPNYAEYARKYKLVPSTLSRRHRGVTTSRREGISENHQNLTTLQEQTLIDHINRLTDRNLPPTAQIVQNIAKEMVGHSIGKNWTSNFIRQHQRVLKSLYLRNIDNQQVKAEYLLLFKYFYDMV